MTIKQAKQNILDLYGDLSWDNVYDYCEEHELNYCPNDFGLQDEF